MVRWFLYIVRCATGQLYTGITTDLERRISQHNRGVASKFTRTRLPVFLVYQEHIRNRSLATKREREIKRMKLSKKLSLIRMRN